MLATMVILYRDVNFIKKVRSEITNKMPSVSKGTLDEEIDKNEAVNERNAVG